MAVQGTFSRSRLLPLLLKALMFLCALKPLLLLSSALFCLLQMTTNAIYVLYQYGLDPLHYYFEDPEDRPAFSVCVFAL